MPRALFAVSLLLLLANQAAAANWPEWRGPDNNGVAAGTGYPTEWSDSKNVIWKVSLPGWGTSTPAIWEERIFVTGEIDGNNALICLNRDGEKLWQAVFGPSSANKNRKAGSANPSPVTDGRQVFAYFKSGDLAAVDFDGKTVWQTNLQAKYGPDRLNWDLGTSPVLTKDLVVVAVMHQGPSYLVALDKATGREVWKQSRDLGAPAEARDSYSTPIVLQQDGQQTLLVLGADFVTLHDAATGKEIWRVGTLNPQQQRNFRSIASPAVAGDMLVAPYARGETLTAIRLGSTSGSASRVAWELDGPYSDVPTPVIHEGKVYVCGDRGDITCIELATGKVLWTEPLPRNRYPYSSSPIIADGKLYATREDGTTFVLKLGDKPQLLATNTLRENTYATPVFVDGRIYLRTSDFLFCLGEK